jgi:hypothetical protein
VLDLVLGAILTIGGGVVKAIRADQRELRAAHDQLVHTLPDTYARRDDVKDGFAELKRQHAEISAKLDRLIERG